MTVPLSYILEQTEVITAAQKETTATQRETTAAQKEATAALRESNRLLGDKFRLTESLKKANVKMLREKGILNVRGA